MKKKKLKKWESEMSDIRKLISIYYQLISVFMYSRIHVFLY